MLKKRDRLTAKDIESLSLGKSVFGTLISLRFLPAEKTKVSVSVSKKEVKTAVGRGRIRRRAYAAAEKSLSKFKKTVFVLVMPKKECADVPFAKLCTETEALFAKAGFLS